jgi:hypothetical protein
MDAVYSSEASINFCQTIRLHIVDDSTLLSQHSENLKSQILIRFVSNGVRDISDIEKSALHLVSRSFCNNVYTEWFIKRRRRGRINYDLKRK